MIMRDCLLNRMDATLREVTRLIRTGKKKYIFQLVRLLSIIHCGVEHELAKRRDVKFAYSSVYVDMRSGRFQQRKIGVFFLEI